jgi:hypothetical protein
LINKLTDRNKYGSSWFIDEASLRQVREGIDVTRRRER